MSDWEAGLGTPAWDAFETVGRGVRADLERSQVIEVLKKQARVGDLLEAWGADGRLADAEVILRRYDSPDRHPDAELPFKGSAEVLVDVLGEDILANRGVRYALAVKASAGKRSNLLPSGSRARVPHGQATAIADRKWVRGGPWARQFTAAFGFPNRFAGTNRPRDAPEAFSEVLSDGSDNRSLLPFQRESVSLVHELLAGKIAMNRGILSLPTGAGKTRTAVSALLDHRENGGSGTQLWIAQTEEVCDQAVREFTDAWKARTSGRILSIGKLYAGSDFGRERPDVVVAGIQKLANLSPGRLRSLGQSLECVVIDEAHSSVARSYTDVLEGLRVGFTSGIPSQIPVLGLTATPGRGTDQETRTLVRRFADTLLRPPSLGDDPVEMLRAEGVLSKPVHNELEHKGAPLDVDLKPSWRAHWDRFRQIPPGMYKLIGEDPFRNRAVVGEIERHVGSSGTGAAIVFACSVEHAMALSAILRRNGIRADYVTGDTHPGRRAQIVEDLRSGDLQVILNYGVLAVGFDAPNVDAIIVARPTMSAVLYEQMIGRGMRGPKFSGTGGCRLVDVRDNLKFDGQLAYQRYIDYWNGSA